MKNFITVLFALVSIFGLCHSQNETNGLERAVAINELDSSIQEGRIMYGYLAQARQFPHMAWLLNRKSTGSLTICGGSLISTRHVLTAAHCVNDVVSTTVGLGSIDRNRAYLNIQANIFTQHPQYNPGNLNNDVAIWTLPFAVTVDANVKPIRLPSYAQVNNEFNGATATISGFGRYSTTNGGSSSVLRYVNVKVIPNPDCQRIYGIYVVIDSTLCTLGLEFNEQGTCNGDSGSPLIIREGTENTQVGVASFVSSRGCGSDRPTGYVRVSKFLFWINQVTGVAVRY